MRHNHTTPHIDYTRRDYAGFRQLLLDHLAVLAPGWAERAEADMGVAVVDILAYVADYMSYYQDAVATEAYLGTARLRRSVRRHARLLDYHLHDGCNARAWVTVEVHGKLTLPRGTQLFAGGEGPAPPPVVRAGSADHRELISRGSAVVFETLHAATLDPAHNRLGFAQGGPNTLAAGATGATLAGPAHLQPGDVLILEEVVSPHTGLAADADPAHRHAVRLTSVRAAAAGVTVAWDAEDALPFELVTHAAFGGEQAAEVSVARGNVVLADHGRTVAPEELPPIPHEVRYRPRLRQAGLTFAEPYDHPVARAGRSAAATLAQRPEAALPAISLVELSPRPLDPPAAERNGSGHQATLVPTVEHPAGSGQLYAAKPWTLRATLLSSGIFMREYRVEMEEGGVAYLRFGFAEAGWQPATVGAGMLATYRVGGGPSGNVGQDAVAAIAVADPARVIRARNPLAARGGTAAQSVAAARLHAPHAYRSWKPPEREGAPEYAPQAFTTQERCVTLEDYAAVAARHPEVAQAVAQPAWTGSARQVVVHVSRHDGALVGRAFCAELRDFLEPYRTAGPSLAIAPPRYVPLAVSICVQLRPGEVAALARQTLLQALVGPEGFFSPAAFGFGQPVPRSKLIAHLAALPAVAWVDVPVFRRAGAERDADLIMIGPLEIARLAPAVFLQSPDALRVEGGR